MIVSFRKRYDDDFFTSIDCGLCRKSMYNDINEKNFRRFECRECELRLSFQRITNNKNKWKIASIAVYRHEDSSMYRHYIRDKEVYSYSANHWLPKIINIQLANKSIHIKDLIIRLQKVLMLQ
jgi:hypothetical protein